MDFIDEIALLITLHWVENFKFCNKHKSFLARHLGFVTKKVSQKDLISQLDKIWQHHNLLNFT